jgi:hypothetical protein
MVTVVTAGPAGGHILCEFEYFGAHHFPGVDMANRGTPRGLFRYGVGLLVLIIVAWIIYAVAGGTTTPGPKAVLDSTVAPKVQP